MFCGSNVCFDNLPVCSKCIHILSDVINAKCRFCGRTVGKCECGKNKEAKYLFNYTKEIAVYSFIWHLKTSVDERTMDFVAEMLIFGCAINPKRFDGVTYVPRSRLRKRVFGYDQSEELASAISRRCGIPVVNELKRRRSREQKNLSAKERFENANRSFALKRVIPEPERYKKLLLVDDLSTTGATVNTCAKLLRTGIANQISLAVLAKTSFKE